MSFASTDLRSCSIFGLISQSGLGVQAQLAVSRYLAHRRVDYSRLDENQNAEAWIYL